MITSIQLKHFKRDSVDVDLLNFTLNAREKALMISIFQDIIRSNVTWKVPQRPVLLYARSTVESLPWYLSLEQNRSYALQGKSRLAMT